MPRGDERARRLVERRCRGRASGPSPGRGRPWSSGRRTSGSRRCRRRRPTSQSSPSGWNTRRSTRPLNLSPANSWVRFALAPVEDLDAGRAVEVVDVADLADAADGEPLAVGREGQRADAADRVTPLHRVPGVHAGRLERGGLLARRDVPDDDVADLVAGRQVAGRRARRRRRRASTGSGAASVSAWPRSSWTQLAGLGVPEPADHVVGDAGDGLAVAARRRRRGSTWRGPRRCGPARRVSRSHQISLPS